LTPFGRLDTHRSVSSRPSSPALLVAALAQAAGGVYWMIFERVAGGGYGELAWVPLGFIVGVPIVVVSALLVRGNRAAFWLSIVGDALAILFAIALVILLVSGGGTVKTIAPPPPFVLGGLALVALPSLAIGRKSLRARMIGLGARA
jgi:hypothetical protein